MTATDFTSGPWTANDEGGIAYGIAYRAVTSGNVVVAQVAKIPEGRANAGLIAAAPELYVLLCAALAHIGADNVLSGRIGAVLAKARGASL